MSVSQFLAQATEPAPGVATPLAKFRKAYEQHVGRSTNRSVFAAECASAGCRLLAFGKSVVIVADRRLREPAGAIA